MSSAMTISHFGLCVTDLDKATDFFSKALGFDVLHTVEAGPTFGVLAGLPGMELQARFIQKDGVKVELLYYRNPVAIEGPVPRPMNQLGITHMALSVEDVDAVVAKILEHGGQHFPETMVDVPGAGKLVMCSGPDGVRLELWQKPRP